MLFKTLALSVLLAGQAAQAFNPAASFVNKVPLSDQVGSVGKSNVWTPTGRSISSSSSSSIRPSSIKTIMAMVAGGAERSQGDDYYEGEFWNNWHVACFMNVLNVCGGAGTCLYKMPLSRDHKRYITLTYVYSLFALHIIFIIQQLSCTSSHTHYD